MIRIRVPLLLFALVSSAAAASDFSNAMTKQGFALFTHAAGMPPQATVDGATCDTFALPPEGPSFTLDVAVDGTVTLPANSLPMPPGDAMGWRVSLQFTAEGMEKPKRTGYEFVAKETLATAHSFRPPGQASTTAQVHTRAAMPVRQTRSFGLGVLPAAAHFHTDYALLNDWRADNTSGARFTVSLSIDNAAPQILHEDTIIMGTQVQSVPPWRTINLDLSRYAGQSVTLLLDTYDAVGAPIPNMAFPLWGDPILYTTTPPTTPAGPSVLLVSLDTVRADRLGCYGYPRGTTPMLDALAREAFLFENALTPAPMTTPAHASVFLGVSPYRHRAGVFSEGFRLSDHWPPLAQLLGARGYRCAAFTEGIAVAGSIGFSRGFQAYSDGASPHSHDRELIRMTFADATAWLQQFGHLPSLLFAHTYHAHDPYTAPDVLLDRFTDPAYMGRLMSNPKDAKTLEEKRSASDCYDAGLAHTDAKFGEFIQGLKDSGQLDHRWLIVFSDHGEEFWEHGSAGHARALYRESVHVPLLIRPPGGLPGGQRVADPVLITDLFATILTLTRTPLPSDRDSRDLLALARGNIRARDSLHGFYRGYEFPKFAQEETKEWETFSLRTPAFTYVTTAPKPGDPPIEELFAPNDLKEKDNLAPSRADLLDAARQFLKDHRNAEDQQRRDNATPTPALKPNELDALQGLGYF